MRIIILQGAFFPVPPLLGGAVEKMWFRLGQEFALAGHNVIQISRRHPELKNLEVICGVQHIRISGYETPASMPHLKWCDLCYTLRAMPHIKGNADIIVTNTFWAPPVLSLFSKIPIYVDVARMPKGQMRLYVGASRLRANSAAVVSAILREWPAAAPKIRMIPNPLPFNSPALGLDIAHKSPTVLYAGRLHEEKGLMLLLKAWSRLPAKLAAEWKLQIAGSWQVAMGGSGQAFFNKLHSLIGKGHIEFTGFVQDPSDLNSLYKKASIFVYPSLAESGETFGLSALEAMAWGCVPVVSSMDCFKDFIHSDINGLVFDHRASHAIELLAECLMSLMRHDKKRKKLAAAAMQVGATHSAPAIAREFLKDFESILL